MFVVIVAAVVVVSSYVPACITINSCTCSPVLLGRVGFKFFSLPASFFCVQNQFFVAYEMLLKQLEERKSTGTRSDAGFVRGGETSTMSFFYSVYEKIFFLHRNVCILYSLKDEKTNLFFYIFLLDAYKVLLNIAIIRLARELTRGRRSSGLFRTLFFCAA